MSHKETWTYPHTTFLLNHSIGKLFSISENLKSDQKTKMRVNITKIVKNEKNEKNQL